MTKIDYVLALQKLGYDGIELLDWTLNRLIHELSKHEL